MIQIADRTLRRFVERFGREPECLVAAPGRVNLIGEHTDYNDGFVFPMGIERYTVIAASPNPGQTIRIGSTLACGEATIDLDAPLEPGEPRWANYVLGVMAGFQALAVRIQGFDAWVDSTVPLGGGLSSSAALEVAAATVLETLTGHSLDPVQKALLCQKAEQDFAGVPCGIMDQFVSVMARENHLLLLDCRSRFTELIPFADPDLSILIINSNVKHELTGGGYAERRAQCESAARVFGLPSLRDLGLPQLEEAQSRMGSVVYRRARHVVSEIQRTTEAAREMRAHQWSNLGRLMYASHHSLRDDFEVSCAELDLLVELAENLGERGGVLGSRMTGGGFGGCTVSLVKTQAVESISRHISDAYSTKTGIEATVFVSRPSGGARVLKCPSALGS